MNILGISAGFHDAAVCVLNRWGEIEFASSSERYSKRKNDAHLDINLVWDCLRWNYHTIAYYESPWRHQLARLVSGQGIRGPITTRGVLQEQLGSMYHRQILPKFISYRHHLSHAAAGFQTSPFNEAAVVVIDAVGELDTISIYRAWYDNAGRARYKRVWRQGYPHSIGLFYSAITKHVGLQPMEDEYITMGMAAYGKADQYYNQLHYQFVQDVEQVKFKENLHAGLPAGAFEDANNVDLAAGTQAIAEELIRSVMNRARLLVGSENLVYMGGVALNCLANRFLGDYFGKIWIMPAPGDAGSSVGAAALAYGRRVHWRDAYLGHSIGGEYPVAMALARLESHGIVGVAHGAAEFGPRALGNRSLLADPRGADIKDRVNDIKKRQQFRPFAPVILEEVAENYFDMPRGWHCNPYMQAVAMCKHAEHFPAIVHQDGTSRVQTVSRDSRSGIRQLLEAWYARTGCPMLLNTSLNVRGEPMVNDVEDAERFERLYGVPVLT
jgi:carbamoyltransferase